MVNKIDISLFMVDYNLKKDAYKKLKMYEYIQAYMRHLLPYLHLPGEKACRSSCWTHSMFLLLIFFLFLAFFGLFLYLASIHYLQAQNDCLCLCCGRISNYNCRIKFMASPPSPSYLPLFTTKHFGTLASKQSKILNCAELTLLAFMVCVSKS